MQEGSTIHYDTALRNYTSKRIEEIESADILVGIPCYNNERTIHFLYFHYPLHRGCGTTSREAWEAWDGTRC